MVVGAICLAFVPPVFLLVKYSSKCYNVAMQCVNVIALSPVRLHSKDSCLENAH